MIHILAVLLFHAAICPEAMFSSWKYFRGMLFSGLPVFLSGNKWHISRPLWYGEDQKDFENTAEQETWDIWVLRSFFLPNNAVLNSSLSILKNTGKQRVPIRAMIIGKESSKSTAGSAVAVMIRFVSLGGIWIGHRNAAPDGAQHPLK